MNTRELIDMLKDALFSPKEIVEAEIEEETVEAKEVDNHGYIVVNLTQESSISDGLLVMPVEEPTTYPALVDAMSLVARMAVDYDHVHGKTCRIYRLSPVPDGELHELFNIMKEWRSK